MRLAQFAAVFSLSLLGLIGGCLILSQGGFSTSGKRGGVAVFVPAPEAYLMAAIMFALSVLAMLWLLRETRAKPSICLFTFAGYCGAVLLLTNGLAGLLAH